MATQSNLRRVGLFAIVFALTPGFATVHGQDCNNNGVDDTTEITGPTRQVGSTDGVSDSHKTFTNSRLDLACDGKSDPLPRLPHLNSLHIFPGNESFTAADLFHTINIRLQTSDRIDLARGLAIAPDGNAVLTLFSHPANKHHQDNSQPAAPRPLRPSSPGAGEVCLVQLDLKRDSGDRMALQVANCQRGYLTVIDPHERTVVAGAFGVDANPGYELDFNPDPSASAIRATAGGLDIFVSRYGADKRHDWIYTVGGMVNERLLALTTDAQSNVLVAGCFGEEDVEFAPDVLVRAAKHDCNLFVTKINAAGQHTWTYAPTTVVGSKVLAKALATDPGGDVYVAGNLHAENQEWIDFSPGLQRRNDCHTGPACDCRTTTVENDDIFVLKLSGGDGVLQWIVTLGGENIDRAHDMVLNHVCGDRFDLLLTGESQSPTFNLVPNVQSNDPPTHCEIGVDGCLDMTGGRAFVARMMIGNDGPTHIWSRRLGGLGADNVGLSVAVDANGQTYVTGSFTNDDDCAPADFDLTNEGCGDVPEDAEGAECHHCYGHSDMFLTKLDRDGRHLTTLTHGGPGAERGHHLVIDAGSDLWIEGMSSEPVQFEKTRRGTPSPEMRLRSLLWHVCSP